MSQQKTNILIKNKEPNRIVTGPEALATRLIHRCAEVLQRHYPKHFWHISMPTDQSVIYIRNGMIHPRWAMVVHTLEAEQDPDLKCIVRAGGELLERAYLSRGKYTEDPTRLDITHSNPVRTADLKRTEVKAGIKDDDPLPESNTSEMA